MALSKKKEEKVGDQDTIKALGDAAIRGLTELIEDKEASKSDASTHALQSDMSVAETASKVTTIPQDSEIPRRKAKKKDKEKDKEKEKKKEKGKGKGNKTGMQC